MQLIKYHTLEDLESNYYNNITEVTVIYKIIFSNTVDTIFAEQISEELIFSILTINRENKFRET